MIAKFNQAQILKAAGGVICGVLCLWLTYLFFLYLPTHAAKSFGYRWSTATSHLIALLCLAGVIFSGYKTWQAKGGLNSYHESALYFNMDNDTGGGVMINHYVQQVTGPAYFISQIMLSGPLLLLNARSLIESRIPDELETEQRLKDALEALKSANKWQAITEHPQITQDILYLARMGLIDYSGHKGIPRIKAHKNHGV